MIVAFRRHTLLPLDDCLYALQPAIPHLTRSSLHRCLQRHGISRLPEVEGDKPKKKFKRYLIGNFHIDIAELCTGEGKIRLFVAINRSFKFAYVELHEKAGKMVVADFLRNLIEAVPYKIHTILTDNGIQFTNRKQYTSAFEHVCREHEIDRRLTKVNHPWTNGQVERMNRTIKEATVKRYHYDTHSQLETHLKDFISAYNYARRLKTLQGLTPFEYICKICTNEPDQFRKQRNPPLNGTDHLSLLLGVASVGIRLGAERIRAGSPAPHLLAGRTMRQPDRHQRLSHQLLSGPPRGQGPTSLQTVCRQGRSRRWAVSLRCLR